MSKKIKHNIYEETYKPLPTLPDKFIAKQNCKDCIGRGYVRLKTKYNKKIVYCKCIKPNPNYKGEENLTGIKTMTTTNLYVMVNKLPLK